MKIRRAVITAAGLGTRLLPLTKTQPKEMLPVVDKPVLHWVLQEIVEAGIDEVLIISRRSKYSLEDYLDYSDYHDMKNPQLFQLKELIDNVSIFYIRQYEQRGLGDAVLRAEKFVGNEPFVLLLGDTITIPSCTKQLLQVNEMFKSKGMIAVENVPLEYVSRYGIVRGIPVADTNDIYKITCIVEKPSPQEAPSTIAVIGRYILHPEIFAYIRKTPPGKNGELQLTDAIALMIKDGFPFYAYIYKGKRYDIGEKLDWLKANVELGIEDPRIGKEFKEFLLKFLGR
ncbi:MAG: UTP--glucose-1-phosphate uridylyltransferase [Candidatus Korarchaeota archaeon]